MSDKAGTLTQGTIQTEMIAQARDTMQQIVERFKEAKETVADVKTYVGQNWVGEGRNEFETQYSLLISKVSDIGDSLDEMFKALVEAEAKYQEADEGYHQEMVMSMEASGLDVSGADKSDIRSGHSRMSKDDMKAQATSMGGGGGGGRGF